MQLQFQLAILKKGSDSIVDYYQKVKLLSDVLAIASKTLSLIEFIRYLLDGLGSNFELVVTSIITQVDSLSPPQVYSHLLTHEVHLTHQLTNLTATIASTSKVLDLEALPEVIR